MIQNTCKLRTNNFSCDCCDENLCQRYIAYQQGGADAIEEVKHKMISFHTDAIFQYGADIIEARCDAFENLENWLKEQK